MLINPVNPYRNQSDDFVYTAIFSNFAAVCTNISADRLPYKSVGMDDIPAPTDSRVMGK